MKNKIFSLIAAGALFLTGCGSSDKQNDSISDSVKSTETSELVHSKSGYSIMADRDIDENFDVFQFKCGMTTKEMQLIGFNTLEPSGIDMDSLQIFNTNPDVNSFGYEGGTVSLGDERASTYDKIDYYSFGHMLFNGETGELYSIVYTVGVSDEDKAIKTVNNLVDKYNNGSSEELKENSYMIKNVEELNGDLIITYGKNGNDISVISVYIYNEDYNNRQDCFKQGIKIDN
ncbi:MAG: hypothetical protein IJZ64_08360 [Ruminococcus sp.]|nr:hypothetical protein [Ruminococcus sp.]